MPSYRTIIKSTGLIASVQIVQIIFGLVRNKVVALLLGAKGFGIWGLYNTYIEMAIAFSTMGLDQSGVRQISKSEDSRTISKCIWVFRRTLVLASLFTSILSIVLSKTISKAIFNSEDYYIGVIIVSFVIFFNGISKGQIAILNGLRNLKGLAISQILGAIIGSTLCVSLVYLFGGEGIPFFLLSIGLTAAISTWWFVRRMNLNVVRPSNDEIRKELKQLFSLGLGFSLAGIVAALMTWLSRVFLAQHYDFNAVGIYQASWTISNLYIGMILTAMGVDFMPRIMKLLGKPKELNAVINEQIELGILISSIGVVSILVFSPLILKLLYSSEFTPGVNIIRWQVLGVGLRVVAFPFSYVVMAHNKPRTYVIIQTIFWVTDFLLLVLFSNLFGFDGLGVNYFFSYMLYLFMSFVASYRICKFTFSKLAKKISIISFMFIAFAWLVTQYAGKYSYMIGVLLIILVSLWISTYLKRYMNINIFQMVKSRIKNK